jgi:hypothetical protein
MDVDPRFGSRRSISEPRGEREGKIDHDNLVFDYLRFNNDIVYLLFICRTIQGTFRKCSKPVGLFALTTGDASVR